MVKTDGKIFGKKLNEVYSIHQNGIINIEKFEIISKSEKSNQIIKYKVTKNFSSFHLRNKTGCNSSREFIKQNCNEKNW